MQNNLVGSVIGSVPQYHEHHMVLIYIYIYIYMFKAGPILAFALIVVGRARSSSSKRSLGREEPFPWVPFFSCHLLVKKEANSKIPIFFWHFLAQKKPNLIVWACLLCFKSVQFVFFRVFLEHSPPKKKTGREVGTDPRGSALFHLF